MSSEIYYEIERAKEMNQLISGNEAIFEGALRVGATYFAGYPISPTSEILQKAAVQSEEDPKFHFLQAEDEIAACPWPASPIDRS